MALALSYDRQTRNLLDQAMQQTSKFRRQSLWKDAVTVANQNQTVVKMRLMERRKNNAKIKSKFKRDILGSPHILAYLGRPVSVSSSLFSIQFNTPSVLKLTFVMNKQLLNISSLFKLSFTLLKVESKNTSDRFPSLTNDVTQTNNKNYECECSKACFFVNLKTQSSLGWKDQGTPFSHWSDVRLFSKEPNAPNSVSLWVPDWYWIK